MMTYANNVTVKSGLIFCDQTWNINQTEQDLSNLYQKNTSNPIPSVFANLSITNFTCTSDSQNYFEYIVWFLQSVTLSIQVKLVSIYFDYLANNNYSLNGFHIDRQSIELSSITLNDIPNSDACSSSNAADEPLCSTNSSTPVCVVSSDNPWNFTCGATLSPSANVSLSTTTKSYNMVSSSTANSILSTWQIGLISGFGVFIVLMLILLAGFWYRRWSRSKAIALSRENLFDDFKAMQKNGVPYGQAFQRTTTLVQPKRNNTAISWIQDGVAAVGDGSEENYIALKSSGPYNQRVFVDHVKVHGSTYPPLSPQQPATVSIDTLVVNPNSSSIPKTIPTTIIPQPILRTSINRLKSITDDLEESALDESDSISLNRPNSPGPLFDSKKPGTPISKQSASVSLADDSLHDEDAWMPILDVVNAELAVLNQLESDEGRTRTLV